MLLFILVLMLVGAALAWGYFIGIGWSEPLVPDWQSEIANIEAAGDEAGATIQNMSDATMAAMTDAAMRRRSP